MNFPSLWKRLKFTDYNLYAFDKLFLLYFNGLGTCHCGRCKCDNSDGNGLVYGKFCECDDRECIDDETEEICGGMYVNFAEINKVLNFSPVSLYFYPYTFLH